jgi:hypothetical protein
MRRATRIAWLLAVALVSAPPAVPWGDLEAEAERICRQVQDLPTPGAEKIRTLFEAWVALREALLRSEDPQAEPLLERLKSCEYSLGKAEFARICAQVPVAPELHEAELQALLEDCVTLRQLLQRAENPQAKVLLKRLKMCEDFFRYSLELD